MNSFDSRATAPGLVKEGWSATRFRRDVAHAAAALLGRRPNIWSSSPLTRTSRNQKEGAWPLSDEARRRG